METNTVMTVGAPMPVGVQKIEAVGLEPSDNAQTKSVEQPDVVQSERQSGEQEVWEGIMSSAKDNGVDEVFEQLADGQFEEIENTDGDVVYEDVQNLDEDAEQPEEKKDPEKELLSARVDELEQQVGDLKAKNHELFERVQAVEMQKDASNETLLLLIAALYELAQREEDESKKVTMFELLIDTLTAFMRAMIMPEEMGKQTESEKEVRVEKRNAGGESKALLLQMLKERLKVGGGRS